MPLILWADWPTFSANPVLDGLCRAAVCFLAFGLVATVAARGARRKR